MDDDGPVLMIGELARRAGLPVRTIRFWSDIGVLPPAARTGSGRRLYDAACLARLELVVTLRDLGLGLADVRRVLDARASVAEVAAVRLDALDAQIRTLRLRRAVLAAVVKRAADSNEMTMMNKLARLSAAERRQIIDDFMAEVFEGLNPSPARAARWAGAANLRDNPSAEQIEAWVELADLATNPDFRQRLRQITEIGIQYQAGHGLVDAGWAQEEAEAARRQGVPPDSAGADEVVDRILGGTESPGRAELLAQLEAFTDPRVERYWQLTAIINGRDPFTSPIPALAAQGRSSLPAQQRPRSHPQRRNTAPSCVLGSRKALILKSPHERGPLARNRGTVEPGADRMAAHTQPLRISSSLPVRC